MWNVEIVNSCNRFISVLAFFFLLIAIIVIIIHNQQGCRFLIIIPFKMCCSCIHFAYDVLVAVQNIFGIDWTIGCTSVFLENKTSPRSLFIKRILCFLPQFFYVITICKIFDMWRWWFTIGTRSRYVIRANWLKFQIFFESIVVSKLIVAMKRGEFKWISVVLCGNARPIPVWGRTV